MKSLLLILLNLLRLYSVEHIERQIKMLCVNRLGLNWALRTQGSRVGPTWTLCGGFKESGLPTKPPSLKPLRKRVGPKRRPQPSSAGLVSVSVECVWRGGLLCIPFLHGSMEREDKIEKALGRNLFRSEQGQGAPHEPWAMVSPSLEIWRRAMNSLGLGKGGTLPGPLYFQFPPTDSNTIN